MGGRTFDRRTVTAFVAVLGTLAALSVALAAPGGKADGPDKAVAAVLEPLYEAILKEQPDILNPPAKGFFKPKPIADDAYNRKEYRLASGLSDVLSYDFVKLAVIQKVNHKAGAMDAVASHVRPMLSVTSIVSPRRRRVASSKTISSECGSPAAAVIDIRGAYVARAELDFHGFL